MEQQSDHIYYTLLWQLLGFAVPFSKLCKNAGPKPFCKAKPTFLTSFLYPILIAGSHTEHPPLEML